MNGRRDDEVVAYKNVWVGLKAVSDLPRGYWRSTLEKQAWTWADTLYQFDIRLSDNPLFYERSYSLFIRGKAGNRAEFIETSDTVDQRMRQQSSHMQVIDTRSVDTYSMNELRQRGKGSEEFGIGSGCGVPRRSVIEDLFGEVEDTRNAESGSRIRIPGYSVEVQTETEVEFTEEICGQINQDIDRAVLSEFENSGNGELPTEEKIIERSIESCGPDDHHATEMDYVLSAESEELSDESRMMNICLEIFRTQFFGCSRT